MLTSANTHSSLHKGIYKFKHSIRHLYKCMGTHNNNNNKIIYLFTPLMSRLIFLMSS